MKLPVFCRSVTLWKYPLITHWKTYERRKKMEIKLRFFMSKWPGFIENLKRIRKKDIVGKLSRLLFKEPAKVMLLIHLNKSRNKAM